MSVRPLPSPGDDVVERVVDAIRERSGMQPVAALVLGSGLGPVIQVAGRQAGSRQDAEIPYADLPGFPRPSVLGHAGRLWIGEIGPVPFAVFQGRVHYYEGHPMRLASITTRVAAALGAGSIVLTAATGGVVADLEPGSLLVVRDHLNLMGENPLRGWRMPDGSPPFVDLSSVYDPELAGAALEAAGRVAGEAARNGEPVVPVREGVYAALSGPTYETPAETEAVRRAGGTVVGMSMVPEAVVARALGLRVLGLSFVTNVAGAPVSHQEVLAASDRAAGAIGRTLAAILDRL
ncbi:MAG TPA: purine-nucleoside phosphorylase [Actinomycetota bacterium]